MNTKLQGEKMSEPVSCFTPFSAENWDRLQAIEGFLAGFKEFTSTVSNREPQTTLAILIYYELRYLLHDAAFTEKFSTHHPEISVAVTDGLKKFQKYYNLKNEQEDYYFAFSKKRRC